MNQRNVFSFRQLAAIAAFLLLTGAVLILTWQSLHRFLARTALDYFYPWFRIASSAEDFTAQQALALSRTRFELAKEVRTLQRENARLAADAALQYSLRTENDRLRSLLHLRIPAGVTPVYAEVILRDPLTWNEVFTIDRGSNDGIREGDAVLSVQLPPSGRNLITVLAGRILSVSRHTAVVATLLHRECTVGVLLSESGEYGILQGTGAGNPPIVSSLPVAGRYAPGEILLTGGYSTQTPAGLYVGTLQPRKDGSLSQVRDHLYAEAEVRPAADFDKIHFVAVLAGERK